MKPTRPTALLTPEQFAAHSGYHYQTVLYWCRRGDLKTVPRTKPRQHWRIHATELARCLTEGFPETKKVAA